MATDEERREAAARFRDNRYPPMTTGFMGDIFAKVYGDEEIDFSANIFMRLADLIEPAPERTYRNLQSEYGKEFECSECQYRNDWMIAGVWRYCPNCGARVVSGDGR